MKASSPSLLKTYYALTKPGIIYGNALTVAGGFFLAAKGHASVGLFLATLGGACLVMASGCVFNNWLDRDIDSKMPRTKKRALAEGIVSARSALIFATVLGLIGISLLAAFTNWLTVIIGLLGLLFYVVIYAYWKRRSPFGTVVGSIAGAVPPVAGYCAVTNRFDAGAFILFMILALWQMPHFYAIAMYRLEEYKAADIPVLPAVKGMSNTKLRIFQYMIAFFGAVIALTLAGYTGYTYLVIMTVLCLVWLWRGAQGLRTEQHILWARKIFLFSLIVLTTFSVLLALNAFLP